MKTEEHQGGKTPFDRVLDWMAALASILLLAITLEVPASYPPDLGASVYGIRAFMDHVSGCGLAPEA
jgi:hypothetical protein